LVLAALRFNVTGIAIRIEVARQGNAIEERRTELPLLRTRATTILLASLPRYRKINFSTFKIHGTSFLVFSSGVSRFLEFADSKKVIRKLGFRFATSAKIACISTDNTDTVCHCCEAQHIDISAKAYTAHLSSDAMRIASASTKLSSSPSGSDLFT
jgi:hypothetical protein